MRKAIVITLGMISGVAGVLAICAHLADAARLALYVPEDDDDEDIYIWLSNPVAIEYIRNSLKRVRKKESALVLASQNLEDFDQPACAR